MDLNEYFGLDYHSIRSDSLWDADRAATRSYPTHWGPSGLEFNDPDSGSFGVLRLVPSSAAAGLGAVGRGGGGGGGLGPSIRRGDSSGGEESEWENVEGDGVGVAGDCGVGGVGGASPTGHSEEGEEVGCGVDRDALARLVRHIKVPVDEFALACLGCPQSIQGVEFYDPGLLPCNLPNGSPGLDPRGWAGVLDARFSEVRSDTGEPAGVRGWVEQQDAADQFEETRELGAIQRINARNRGVVGRLVPTGNDIPLGLLPPGAGHRIPPPRQPTGSGRPGGFARQVRPRNGS